MLTTPTVSPLARQLLAKPKSGCSEIFTKMDELSALLSQWSVLRSCSHLCTNYSQWAAVSLSVQLDSSHSHPNRNSRPSGGQDLLLHHSQRCYLQCQRSAHQHRSLQWEQQTKVHITTSGSTGKSMEFNTQSTCWCIRGIKWPSTPTLITWWLSMPPDRHVHVNVPSAHGRNTGSQLYAIGYR